jgi:hypothetical protein
VRAAQMGCVLACRGRGWCAGARIARSRPRSPRLRFRGRGHV